MIFTEGTHVNCKFMACIDEEKEVLHILDIMKNEPYKSVTNAVQEVIPFILKTLRQNGQLKSKNVVYRILCYGTDGEVAEFLPFVFRFKYVPKDSEVVYPEFRKLMEEMYS